MGSAVFFSTLGLLLNKVNILLNKVSISLNIFHLSKKLCNFDNDQANILQATMRETQPVYNALERQ